MNITAWDANPSLVDDLRRLWDEGHPTAEIARRLGHGLTKNAIIGKAGRLGLSRPSPIQRGVVPKAKPAAPRRISGPTLPPLAAVAGVAQVPVARPSVMVAPRPFAQSKACCWPIGEPRTPGFRFCEADSIPGRPYCEPHTRIAYTKQLGEPSDFSPIGGQLASAVRHST